MQLSDSLGKGDSNRLKLDKGINIMDLWLQYFLWWLYIKLNWFMSNLVVNPKYGGFAKLCLEERNSIEVRMILTGGFVP